MKPIKTYYFTHTNTGEVAMKTAENNHLRQAGGILVVLAALCWPYSSVLAADTDIYTSSSSKQNCEVFIDNSLSMTFMVYDNTVDYGAMYDYLYKKGSTPVDATTGAYTNNSNSYIYDTTIGNGKKTDLTPNPLLGHHYQSDKIYLVSGPIGLGKVTVGTTDVPFTGDPGDPASPWPWDLSNTIVFDTHTLINRSGTLSTEDIDKDGIISEEEVLSRRITLSPADGTIQLDGTPLGWEQSIALHKYQTLYGNNSIIDSGFGGLLNAPGYYFSGFKTVGTEAVGHVDADVNDTNIYFFVTGNWLNMQAIFNLRYKDDNAATWDRYNTLQVWNKEVFPSSEQAQPVWITIDKNIDYPSPEPSYGGGTHTENITADATKMKIHFSDFDVTGDGNSKNFHKDYVVITDSFGTVLATYDNDNIPADGWTPELNSGNVNITLVPVSRTGGNKDLPYGRGFVINQIEYLPTSSAGGTSYIMKSRLDIAKAAMLFIVETFTRKIDWGLSSYTLSGSNHVIHGLNPSDQDGANQGFPNAIATLIPEEARSPLAEALQYIWVEEFLKSNPAFRSKSICRKNYILAVTDGFPSDDNKTNIIKSEVPSAPDFSTPAGHDTVTWPQDPIQYPTFTPDYYDDVAAWMYNNSWRDAGATVNNPSESDANLRTHQISFGASQPMLEYAASKAGGVYIVANSEAQLREAFYSMAMMMSEAVSFTAPVVSVDAANKIQSGDDLYMGLFLPRNDTFWAGNVKKFKLGNGTTRPDRFMVYDAKNNPALDATGQFSDNLAEFWDDYNSKSGTVTTTDINDTDNNFGSADIQEDGAGQVLLKRVRRYLENNSNYWDRPIYTTINGTDLVPFDQTIPPESLGLAATDTATRNKLVNFMHGYTYDANTDGTPLAVRPWILGSIIHSRPVVVDYLDTTQATLPLKKRFIAVGSNDGMLHVFADTDEIMDIEDTSKSQNGKEMFAFIPMDILPKIQTMPAILGKVNDTVDGLITLHRDRYASTSAGKNPKYLIFGERRGGGSFWCFDVSASNLNDIDPSHWKIKWQYTHSEMVQSWSEVKLAALPHAINATTGEVSYKNIAIFTGGYDPKEDRYPTSTGSNPTSVPGIDMEPGGDKGRGIFAVDIENPSNITHINDDLTKAQLLPFTATYGATLTGANSATQTIPDMQFSFPATPTVVTTSQQYPVDKITQYKENVLRSLYAIDIYANLFKTGFSFTVANAGTTASPNWQIQSAGWDTVTKIFKANPGSTKTYAGATGVPTTDNALSTDIKDKAMKAFYPPTLSWGGTKGYFQAGNYYSPDATFSNLNTMASLFFGTGDREHPLNPAAVRNRFYALYDDTSITATATSPSGTMLTVPPQPKTELNLLNLTCDELGQNTTITSCYLPGATCNPATASADMKKYLQTLLTDDVTTATGQLEYQAATNAENDAKGWYIVLSDQGNTAKCPYVTYPTTIQASTITAHDNHAKEQVLSQALLYYGSLYFTTYQPADTDDPCNQQGNGFAYALDYLDGSAVYDLNQPSTNDIQDVTDRYKKFDGIYGIPSGFTIVLRDGHAAAMASMGGAIVGPGPDTNNPFEIATPGLGLEIFYWRDSNSMQP
jgi:type IV pilus assembly protein PilY1